MDVTRGKQCLTVTIKLDPNWALSLRLWFSLLKVARQSIFRYSVLLCDGKTEQQKKRKKDLQWGASWEVLKVEFCLQVSGFALRDERLQVTGTASNSCMWRRNCVWLVGESTFLYIIALQQLHKTQAHAPTVTDRESPAGWEIYTHPLNQCEK